MNVVLDACAIIAYARNEPGADIVRMLIDDQQVGCFVHVVNLCEVYYDATRRVDEAHAQQLVIDLEVADLIFRDDIDTSFWKAVGFYKATLRRISLADCFALALAKRIGAVIVTSDHHEFDPLVSQGVCSVRFIR
ncbi:MAG: type II toxin-antitoxin system VapC family toxin [Chloroflexaceae bacterium]|nr:type II toxin-antitoxin system VapC family toxin [Chloroflexaceae bacterium]